MNSFTIKDLENLSGIKAHTIRIWEKRYGLLKPERTGTNIRLYKNEELKSLLNISLLNKFGFRISRIAKMSFADITNAVDDLQTGDAAVSKLINNLVRYTVDMDAEAFEALADKYIGTHGTESAVKDIIFPYFEKVGILWTTDRIDPAREHIVSCIIRQKILAATDGLRVKRQTAASQAVLFLPPGEHHELALIFLNFLLRSRNIYTTYIGSNIPLEHVAAVAAVLKPDFLYTHVTSAGKKIPFDNLIKKLKIAFPRTPVYISGRAAQQYRKKAPANIHIKHSLAQVMDFIEGLKK